MGESTKVPCPNCGAPVPWADASRWRPFCSERCKMVDLGEWFEESRRIPGEPAFVPDGNEDENTG